MKVERLPWWVIFRPLLFLSDLSRGLGIRVRKANYDGNRHDNEEVFYERRIGLAATVSRNVRNNGFDKTKMICISSPILSSPRPDPHFPFSLALLPHQRQVAFWYFIQNQTGRNARITNCHISGGRSEATLFAVIGPGIRKWLGIRAEPRTPEHDRPKSSTIRVTTLAAARVLHSTNYVFTN